LLAASSEVANLREGLAELAAHRGQNGDHGDGDQGGDQAVFDGRGARFVFGETRNELGHG
jgi:hypothetical protein